MPEHNSRTVNIDRPQLNALRNHFDYYFVGGGVFNRQANFRHLRPAAAHLRTRCNTPKIHNCGGSSPTPDRHYLLLIIG